MILPSSAEEGASGLSPLGEMGIVVRSTCSAILKGTRVGGWVVD